MATADLADRSHLVAKDLQITTDNAAQDSGAQRPTVFRSEKRCGRSGVRRPARIRARRFGTHGLGLWVGMKPSQELPVVRARARDP